MPHILNVSVKGIRGTRMQQALNEKGICVSGKSACAVEGTPSKAVYAVCRDRTGDEFFLDQLKPSDDEKRAGYLFAGVFGVL